MAWPFSYPSVELPYKNPSWDNLVPSQVKGETENQVKHAKNISSLNNDTSVDGPWWVHRNWSFSDFYTMLIMALFWVPLWIFWIPFFILSLPPVALNLLYIMFRLPVESECIRQDTIDWKLHCILQFLLSLPVQVMAILTLAYSHLIMTTFGSLYLLVNSFVHCQNPVDRYRSNLNVIAPYDGGPNLYLHFGDCVAAVAGSVHRQGLFEFTIAFANMFIINPWMKYWMTGNLYLEDLGERFITQIGQSLNDVDVDGIDMNVRKAISRAKHNPSNRQVIDSYMFGPFYPYPPAGRRYAIGMQHTKCTTNFVHATHFRSPEVSDEGPIATLSTSAILPIYRVMLWRNNPYHIYTGYVEANISNGSPSQPEKVVSLEHPMWLVNSRNKLAADRNVTISLGSIDSFFDKYIPQMNHFVRLNTVGLAAADAALAADPRKGYEATKYQYMAEC